MLKQSDPSVAWFTDAKLGLFIHWGLYSATEGIIDGKETKGICEWIQLRERVPGEKYVQYTQNLTMDRFDAKELMELAASAGMRYVVFTAKHHEGFSMYDTKYDDYSITGCCGTARDPVRELAEAAREKGIVPGLYYSQGLDFHEPNAMGNTWDYERPEDNRDFDSYLDGKCKFQLRELLGNYGDIGLIWFDVPWGMNNDRASVLHDLVKSLQPHCLVNSRLGGRAEDSDFLCMGDNEIPYVRATVAAEACATTNNSWGYKRMDHNFKNPKMIIEQLCALVSKGANLLLNIGPKPDGSIPEEAVAILRRLGNWMSVNGDAIYGTQASVFPGDFSFGWSAWKNNRLFLYIREPEKEIRIFGLKNQILNVETMSGENVPFRQKMGMTHLDLRNIAFDDCVTVLALELNGNPAVERGLFQQEEDYVHLPACECKILGENREEVPTFDMSVDRILGEYWRQPDMQMKVNVNGILECWHSEKNEVTWDFELKKPGRYQVTLYTLTGKYQTWIGGHRVRLFCGDRELKAELTEDVIPFGVNRKYFSEAGSHLGVLDLEESGMYRLKLSADKINPCDQVGLSVAYLQMRKIDDR